MKKLLTKIAFIAAGFTGVAYAQQDPQFTQFMFNKLIYNPGYAGTSGAICGVVQYRQQWSGFTGAPKSTAVCGDMRLSTLPLGIGLNVMTDKIGSMSTFFMRGAAAFNQKIGSGTLGVGVDLGILQKQINNEWIVPEPLKGDPRIPGAAGTITNPDFNKLTFDVGLGAFYQIPGKFYVGVSSTHLPAQDIKSGNLGFQVSRHYYFMAGYTFNASPWLDVTPNLLYRTDVAASSLDANVNLTWFKLFWVGGTYRVGENTGAILLGVQKAFGTGNSMMGKFGYSYDIKTKVKVAGGGTHELFLGVCYTPKIKKETTYSNDRYWGN
jgi:type IX secretion system PorP/SprF family membrane protein